MPFASYAQNFEDVLLWRALKDVESGFYIDVGAWEPDLHSVTRSFSERGWRGINVEPMAGPFARLQAQRPRDVNLPVAAGAAPGTKTLYEVADTGLSTLDALLAQSHAASGHGVTTREIEVQTLAGICAWHAPDVIHFLKLDCEGAERDALAGADFTRFRPWIVLAEATLPNSPEASFAAWEDLLLQADYRFVWFDGLNRFYVAAEQHERLAARLALPPNVFDDFVLAPPVELPKAPRETIALPAASVPMTLTEEGRIALAQRCRDCDDIAKVANAGRVQIEPDGTRVQIMHNGLKVVADGYCGPWMTRLIALCRGHHEPQEERLFHHVMACLPTDATMLELGGNWAYYTAWFLQGALGRRAVVLEPDPANRAVGERNLQLNRLNARFVAGFAGAQSAPAVSFATERSGHLLLACLSVPDLLVSHAIDVLDVLHCDTQGAELAVLQGARELFLAGRIRWVFVSTHVHQITADPLTHRRCLDLLRDCGAEIEAEHNAHESFSGDGLIVARFGAAPAGWRPVAISLARQSEALFRELAYDLADALVNTRASEELAREVVSGVYETLLFRKPDPGGLGHFTQGLLRNGEFSALLRPVLKSAEFQGVRRRFGTEYLGEAQAVVVVPEAGPFACSGLRLALRVGGPLGQVGDTLLVANDQVILPAILATGAWNTQHLAFIGEHLDPARRYVVLDIGANIGLFSRQVLRMFGNIAECHCVEPDPGNYEALRFNLATSRDVAVTTYPVGLGTADGTVTFFRDSENCGNHSLHIDAMRARPFTETSVEMREAGSWLEAHLAGEAPILWKSDTQGSDEAILSATPWPVWRRVEIAIVELWRIRKAEATPAGFLERVADMPNRRLGGAEVSVEAIADYVAADDWQHDDLYLWR